MDQAAGQGGIGFMVIYILFFVGIMYLLIFLPQRRREKKSREMLEKISVGDQVVTIGGIAGTVINIKDDEVTIESGAQKTKLDFKKWAVKEVKELIQA